MKLDIELCRQILLKIEEEGGVDGMEEFPYINGYHEDYVFYQIKKMSEAGFIKYKHHGNSSSSSNTNYQYFTVEATYNGHEFLQQMLDDTIWSKTKEMAKKSSMKLTFETIKAILPIAINALLNQNN